MIIEFWSKNLWVEKVDLSDQTFEGGFMREQVSSVPAGPGPAREPLPFGSVMLSHAIREGAKLANQSPWDRRHVGATCALGAAGQFVGCTVETGGDERLLDHFPELRVEVAAFEEFSAGTLKSLVCRLNNGGRTRERIADIVESLGF